METLEEPAEIKSDGRPQTERISLQRALSYEFARGVTEKRLLDRLDAMATEHEDAAKALREALKRIPREY